jgi:hypothetical protein
MAMSASAKLPRPPCATSASPAALSQALSSLLAGQPGRRAHAAAAVQRDIHVNAL